MARSSCDLIIENGKVVFPNYTLETSIAIDEGKIVGIGSGDLLSKGERVIDARGKFVLPGGIDPHIHVAMPFMGVTTRDDFFRATKAASWGGTTSIISFATPQRGDITMDTVLKRRDQADGNVVIDYSLHPTITKLTPETIVHIKELIEQGLPTFKLFLVYRKEGIMADDGILYKVFEETKAHGGLVGCHAENVSMIEFLREEALRKGNRSAIYHARTRPPITEAETVNRAIFLASSLGVPYFNFHLAIKEGVNMFRKARYEGLPMYAETCTHYLVNSEEDLKGEDGINYICTPPLRTKEHQEALWKGLSDGALSLVSSDHCAFTTEMKKLGEDSFDKVPNGMPGHEFRVPIMFSEGVNKGRISVNRFSEVVSTNAAKIFGLYPMKGIIQIGSDADLVVLDPKLEKTITTNDSLYDMDWYPYEGMKVKGWPVITVVNGKVMWEENVFSGKAGDGQFLKRKLSPELFKHPIA
jgi:dihydropyrimidinase